MNNNELRELADALRAHGSNYSKGNTLMPDGTVRSLYDDTYEAAANLGGVVMSEAEMLQILRQWEASHKALNGPIAEFRRVTGAMPDCALLEPVYRLWDDYTKMVSEKVGAVNEDLEWYQFECQMGERPMSVRFKDGTEIQGDSLENLAKIIRFLA